jgi:hypothetical protein
LSEELDGEPASYFQTRFWARVELEPFARLHEMTARRLVTPTRFREALFWGPASTAGLILERALATERTAA